MTIWSHILENLNLQQNCTLLGYYTASSGNFLPTFRDNVSVLSSGVKNTKKKSWIFNIWTHPPHFFEFCKHNDNSWIVFPQHPPEVLSGVKEWALCCDVSCSVTVTIYETGIYVIGAFYGTYRCQTHPCWFKWQDVHQSVLMLVAGQVCADEAGGVSLNVRQFL